MDAALIRSLCRECEGESDGGSGNAGSHVILLQSAEFERPWAIRTASCALGGYDIRSLVRRSINRTSRYGEFVSIDSASESKVDAPYLTTWDLRTCLPERRIQIIGQPLSSTKARLRGSVL